VTAPDPVPAADPPPATPPAADQQAPAATEPAAPRSDIGAALGPISGVQGAASATSAAATRTGNDDAPLLSFDAPSAFAPRSLAGRLSGAPGVLTVQVAIRRGGPQHGCGWWAARSARFTAARRSGCATPRWMPASLRRVAGGWRWRAALGATLAPGSYRFLVRVLDAAGRPVSFRRA
jgi:hypothetical protein